ncbi:MAG: DUF2335 domain-containing protein [Robiginitomaculum sp.]|nr:DUF2335 domain-containing protein [Robiginitomaculum sp.]
MAKDTQPDVTGSIEPVPEDDEINLSNEVKSLSEIEDVLGKNLPPKEAQHVLSVVQSHLFSGPLPPPESIAGYEKVLPGSADRIITMAEKSQNHAHNCESRALGVQSFVAKSGMVSGLFISALLVSGGISAVYLGQPFVASVFIGASALGVISKLVDGPSRIFGSTKDKHEPPAPTPPNDN